METLSTIPRHETSPEVRRSWWYRLVFIAERGWYITEDGLSFPSHLGLTKQFHTALLLTRNLRSVAMRFLFFFFFFKLSREKRCVTKKKISVLIPQSVHSFILKVIFSDFWGFSSCSFPNQDDQIFSEVCLFSTKLSLCASPESVPCCAEVVEE